MIMADVDHHAAGVLDAMDTDIVIAALDGNTTMRGVAIGRLHAARWVTIRPHVVATMIHTAVTMVLHLTRMRTAVLMIALRETSLLARDRTLPSRRTAGTGMLASMTVVATGKSPSLELVLAWAYESSSCVRAFRDGTVLDRSDR
jgi:hypothetical protein